MSQWSLAKILAGLHDDIHHRLSTSRKSFAHSTTKGDASEGIWLELFEKYLPMRYQAAKAHVVDSKGQFSDQIDIVIFDRQYSPFIFDYEGQKIVPAESVYAVFEAKQSINAEQVDYAQKKVATVRTLHRTSLPIPHAGGQYPPKPLVNILGGILTLESDWSPALGSSLISALLNPVPEGRLELGCVAAHGTFSLDDSGNAYTAKTTTKPATAMLFELISRLQKSATVPMIDVNAYAAWLA